MCGARIGCVVSRNKELIKTVLKFAQARLSPPTLAQIASLAALDTPEKYFNDVIREYKKRRDVLINELNKIPGIRVSTPKGAFYCIVELPIDDANDFAKWLLESFSVNNQTVMVAPAQGFYSSRDIGKNQIRIAYVLNEKDLISAINILKKALIQYHN
jgi:aspartate aminotransferase